MFFLVLGCEQEDGLEMLKGCHQDNVINQTCSNRLLPEKPSIMRNLLKAGKHEQDAEHISAQDEWFDQDLTEEYKTFSAQRSTVDGKLYFLSGHNWVNYPTQKSIPKKGGTALLMQYFDPELVGYDFKTNGKNPMVNTTPIHPFVTHNFHPSFTDIPVDSYVQNRMPGTYHVEICNDLGDAKKDDLWTCRAPVRSGSSNFIEGDCYNVSLYAFSGWGSKNEVRMNPVTVFVAKAKQAGHREEIFVYPRQNSGRKTLPPISFVKDMHLIGDYNDSSKSNLKELSMACYSNQTPKPYYCEFLKTQEKLEIQRMDGKVNNAPDTVPMFEPSITKDGKLLIVNIGLGGGLYYSYNKKGACKLSGWQDYKPLSEMPYDPDIYNNYAIGKTQRKNGRSIPFRDTLGNIIPRGDRVEGAYLWIDREGKNVFFAAVNMVQDHIKNAQGGAMDHAAGKGYHLLGAWSHGKMVHLDGVINMFNFGHRPTKEINDDFMHEYLVYRGGALTVRPTASTFIGSLENKLNHYDALNPITPFDVSWKMFSNIDRNAEVIFDDYLMLDTVIHAHMNEATDVLRKGGKRYFIYKNGFRPQKDHLSGDSGTKSDFQLVERPVLQNSATMRSTSTGLNIPKKLDLHGGARIENIALGGVYGKGVYLDGVNDFITASVKSNTPRNWILSLWIDLRATSSQKTLIGFPDQSQITIGSSGLVFKKNNVSKSLDLPIKRNQYFHLGFKISTEGANRKVVTYYNGTRLGEEISLPAEFLRFKGLATFSIGNPYQLNGGIRGWVDELRLLEFPGAFPEFTEELMCNHSLGSLVHVEKGESDSRLMELEAIASEFNLFKDDKALICEQLELESHDSMNEFADQEGENLCASKIHMNQEAPERCAHKEFYGLRKFQHDQPRPSFSTNGFCLACHEESNNLESMRLGALMAGTVERQHDIRRQPLDVVPVLYGCEPDHGPFRYGDCGSSESLMDILFDYSAKMSPIN